MRKEEINAVLKLGPKDVQDVEEVVENKFVIFKKKERDENGSLVDLFLFYNLNTGQQSLWFKFETKESLSHGLWLLTSVNGMQRFYNVSTGQTSVGFKFKTKEDLGNGLWLLTSVNAEQCFYNVSTNHQSEWFKFKTKEDLGNGLWLLTSVNAEQCFYNVSTGQTSVWFAAKENLGNGVWLLTDFDGLQCFYNANTNKCSSSLVLKAHKIEEGQIKCFSSYETFTVLDLKTMLFSPFQIQ